MYTITHHYLNLDDDGHAVVELEAEAVDDASGIAAAVAAMIANPGGRSGTTITVTVSRDDAARI